MENNAENATKITKVGFVQHVFNLDVLPFYKQKFNIKFMPIYCFGYYSRNNIK